MPQIKTAEHNLILDVERLCISYGEQQADLSYTEAKILDEMRKSEHVVSRDRLLEKIWDDQSFVDDNTLNVYVTRVRKKLAQLKVLYFKTLICSIR
ncbi:Transcriptional regulatory protein, C terminal [Bacillus sp. OV194]|nr:Transcriptional regulatory protein, C terminal [Bacillus sp. OV194]